MNFVNKLIKIFDGFVSTISVSLLLILMLFSVYALYDVYQVYHSAELGEDIATLKPKAKATSLQLTELQKINPDIVGWITIDETNIDYPILWGKDNSEYINQNYRREYSAAGSIFLDYRNNRLLDDYSIIYGHNMNANLMFGDVKYYKDETFMRNHLHGRIYNDDGIFKLTVVGYALVSAYDYNIYNLGAFRNQRNFEVIYHFENVAMTKVDLEGAENSKLILLSTCDASSVNERAILLAKIDRYTEEELQEIAKLSEQKEKQVKSNDDTSSEKRTYTFKFWDYILILLVLLVVIVYIVLFRKIRNRKTEKEKEELPVEEEEVLEEKEKKKKKKIKKEQVEEKQEEEKKEEKPKKKKKEQKTEVLEESKSLEDTIAEVIAEEIKEASEATKKPRKKKKEEEVLEEKTSKKKKNKKSIE